MGRDDKLFNNIKNNPSNVKFEDLFKLLTKLGHFEGRQGKGDHYTFSHPALDEILTIPTARKPVKRIYVKAALKLYKRVTDDPDA